MARISQWLKPEGLLFVHIFVSNSLPYHYEVRCRPTLFLCMRGLEYPSH